MRVLVIGGTGTMGRYVVSELIRASENTVYAVSRKPLAENSNDNGSRLRYLSGDILDSEFRTSILKEKYDCIIDFVWYTPKTFSDVYKSLLDSAVHYIGMSSGAVSADSDTPISEAMPRFLDVCSDKERKSSHEYHLEKARIEDILINSKYDNWTLIRPHVTISPSRLPLFVYEKEQWLYRVLQGHTVVLSNDALDKKTVITYGEDVAKAIIRLVKNDKAYRQIINITSGQTITRRTLVETYQKILMDNYNIEMKVKYFDNVKTLEKAFPERKTRMKTDRMLNRVFDISKLRSYIGDDLEVTDIRTALSECTKKCVDHLDINNIKYNDGNLCAYMDRVSGEKTPKEYFDRKNRIKYLIARYIPFHSIYIYITGYQNSNRSLKNNAQIIRTSERDAA